MFEPQNTQENLFFPKEAEGTQRKVAFPNLRGKQEEKLDPPVSQLLMLWGALDWCSSCRFINWLIVRAPRIPFSSAYTELYGGN